MTQNGTYIVKEDPLLVERAFLVGIKHPDNTEEQTLELLNELGELTSTLGVPVVGSAIATLRKPQPRYLIGEGKAKEILELAQAENADVIVFDDYLSPSQQRNWEALDEKMAVIDRQEVILDIFAGRAQTREAILQVQLARANYSLPRLKRKWTHLHRQRGAEGGLGGRGEGEQQLEVDSRLARKRIAYLKGQLVEVRKQRGTQRSQRLRKPVPVAAIVGYTNAGKSSLLNAMTNAEVLVENKLFATLDPTVRRVGLPNNQELLLADTVGFIRKLPHLLVEAFKSTLEETRLADLLVEVIDVTGGAAIDEHHETTEDVLKELEAGNKPSILVFNKVDLLNDDFVKHRLKTKYPDAIFASAHTGEGLDEIAERLSSLLDNNGNRHELLLPHSRHDLHSRLHRASAVLSEEYIDEGIRVSASVPPALFPHVEEFVLPPEEK